jgi:hypothetical protein
MNVKNEFINLEDVDEFNLMQNKLRILLLATIGKFLNEEKVQEKLPNVDAITLLCSSFMGCLINFINILGEDYSIIQTIDLMQKLARNYREMTVQ